MDPIVFYRHLKLFDTALFFLFAVFLFRKGTVKKTENRILAFFFLIAVFKNLDFLIYLFGIENSLISFRYLSFPFLFLSAPLLLFYIISLYNDKFRFRWVYLLHAVPFAVSFIFFGIALYFSGTPEKIAAIANGFHPQNYPLFWRGLTVQTAVYMIVSAAVIVLMRKKLKTRYSSCKKVTLSWILVYFSSVCVISITGLIKDLPSLSIHKDSMSLVLEILHFLLLAFVFYKGLTQPAIFLNGRQTDRKESFPKESREYYFKKLLRIMETEKPYLDPDLTLTALAEMVSISPYHLSFIINNSTDGNFYDFISRYRIDECLEIISADGGWNRSIQAIRHDAGFNAKSAFYRAFKKRTGLTPLEYRRNIEKKVLLQG